MKTKNRERKKVRPESTAAVRASISFPREDYENLEGIAKQKKVFLAWVVWDAAEKNVADQLPLLGQYQRET